MLIVLKSGSLNLLGPSRPVQACNGRALPLSRTLEYLEQQTACEKCLMERKWETKVEHWWGTSPTTKSIRTSRAFASSYLLEPWTGVLELTENNTGLHIQSTGYGLGGPGIESRWEARFPAPVQTGPGAHPSFCTMSTRSFPGVKSGRGVTLTPHRLPVPLVMKQ